MTIWKRGALLALAALTIAIVEPAQAQSVKARVLRSLSVEPREDSGWLAVVGFNVPTRVVRSSPAEAGDVVRIRVDFPAVRQDERRLLRTREALPRPPGDESPVDEVVYDGTDPTGAIVEIRFRERVRFVVRQGPDFRSVVVSIEPANGNRAPAPDRVDAWMDAGADAMAKSEFDRAILIFTKVLSAPGDARKDEAREMLGLAYERDGRLAHAVAEYETYLEEYPDAEDTGRGRVRQRLLAIITAESKLPDQRRPSDPEEDRTQFTFFGSASTTLVRDDRWPDESGHDVGAFQQFADLFATGLIDTPGWRFRPETAIRGIYDYEDEELGDGRVSTLQVEFAQTQEGLSGIVGRQSRSRGGVLGRFDGIQLGYRLYDWIRVNAVGGFPLESSTSDEPDTDRVLGGASVDLFAWDDRVELELYGIYQGNQGFLDRAAIGTELRYADDSKNAVAAIDYDVHFNSLNTAVLVWQWQAVERAGLNGVLEYRNTPYLTTENATIGQDTSSLDTLDDSFSTSEIEDLARDRTRREINLTLGGYADLTPVWQVSGDFTASKLGGTPTSGGVEGSNAPGWEYLESVQLSRSEWLGEDDVWTLGGRWYQGSDFDSYSLVGSARWPLFDRRLALVPRARLTFRDPDSGNESVGFLAATRLDYRIGPWMVEIEAGVDRFDDIDTNDDEWGVFVDATLRIDF